jgi:hypothetical protein
LERGNANNAAIMDELAWCCAHNVGTETRIFKRPTRRGYVRYPLKVITIQNCRNARRMRSQALSSRRAHRFAMRGLGLPPGANPSSLPWCGGIKPLQQMLSDLGYYAGRIDGSVGTGTTSAIVAAQKAFGVPTGAISKNFCEALADAWNAKMAAPAPAAPAPGAPAAPQPGVPTETPPNGAMVTAEPQGVMDKWTALPMAAKAGIVGGALLLVGGGIYLAVR